MQDKTLFQPVNNLETFLTAPRSNMSSDDRVDAVLLMSEFYMMVDREMLPGIWDPEGKPLILVKDSLSLIPLFTSARRTELIAETYPEYRYQQLVDFRWLLKGTGEDVGYWINPGLPGEMQLSAKRVANLKAAAQS